MKQISHRRSEPTLEVQLTLTQLRCVVKSLSIGTDQLAKKDSTTW
jgi:hypothetical protein